MGGELSGRELCESACPKSPTVRTIFENRGVTPDAETLLKWKAEFEYKKALCIGLQIATEPTKLVEMPDGQFGELAKLVCGGSTITEPTVPAYRYFNEEDFWLYEQERGEG